MTTVCCHPGLSLHAVCNAAGSFLQVTSTFHLSVRHFFAMAIPSTMSILHMHLSASYHINHSSSGLSNSLVWYRSLSTSHCQIYTSVCFTIPDIPAIPDTLMTFTFTKDVTAAAACPRFALQKSLNFLASATFCIAHTHVSIQGLFVKINRSPSTLQCSQQFFPIQTSISVRVCSSIRPNPALRFFTSPSSCYAHL